MEIAWHLQELADLLEFKGADFFKIKAYRKAADRLAYMEESAEILYQEKKLGLQPGIGKGILAKIEELFIDGKIAQLEELRKEIPIGLLEIITMPGIGIKRAKLFHQKLGITSLEELQQAAKEHRVSTLPGIGAKTELEIMRNAKRVKQRSNRYLLGLAKDLAAEMLRFLHALPEVEQGSVVGSVRRWQETVGDLDLLVSAQDPKAVLDMVASYPRTRDIMQREEDRIRMTTWWGIPVDVLVVSPEQYGYALFWYTGNEGHRQELGSLGLSQGMVITASGMKTSEGQVLDQGMTEEKVYDNLGIRYIPPELREGKGEVTLIQEQGLPQLVTLGDIKGDLHIHTDWSDGTLSILDMMAKAKEKGYQYMAITDHSQSLAIARGLNPQRVLEQYRLIDEINAEQEDFKILKGIEVDILAKGGLDLPDTVLAQADVVIASVHSGFKQDAATMTARILQALENPHVDIIGHPTGRMLGHREPYALDLERIMEVAAQNKKILEINSSPERLDLGAEHIRMAQEYGIRMVINTDAHDVKRMDYMEYGVATARRGWLKREQVLNTLALPDLLALLQNMEVMNGNA